MIRSMTGFGSASTQEDGARYVLEIRSLNNKYFKAQVRLPEDLQGLEAELDSALAKRINRGSLVVAVRYSDTSANSAAKINVQVIQAYLDQLCGVSADDHTPIHVDLGALLALPGAVITDTGEERLVRARDVLLRLIDQAGDKLIAMRGREGAILHRDLHGHCKVIADHLVVVKKRVPELVELFQTKLSQRMQALLAESGASVREEDVLREVAVFAERSDVAEEVARLQGHLTQFAELIDAEKDEPIGRTLDFIAQEMLREANTIGSKCLDVEVSKRIVEVKGAIDRIKEQVQNVE